MKNQEQIEANTSWANESIAMRFAEENIPHKYIALFYFFVRRSFGYFKTYTPRITIKEISKITKLSEPTIISYIKYLVENNFVSVNKSNRFIENGGSEAYSYSPCFPRGYGKINIKNDKQEQNKTQSREPEIVEKVKAPYKDMDF